MKKGRRKNRNDIFNVPRLRHEEKRVVILRRKYLKIRKESEREETSSKHELSTNLKHNINRIKCGEYKLAQGR